MAKELLGGINTGVGECYYSVLANGVEGAWKKFGDLVSFALNPSTNTTKLYASDREIIIEDRSTVTGNIVVPAITDETLCAVMGYELTEKGEIVYSNKAVKPEIRLGIIANNYDGVTDYITVSRAKLSIPNMQGSTKTENVSFATQQYDFSALADVNGVWAKRASSDQQGFVKPTWATPTQA